MRKSLLLAAACLALARAAALGDEILGQDEEYRPALDADFFRSITLAAPRPIEPRRIQGVIQLPVEGRPAAPAPDFAHLTALARGLGRSLQAGASLADNLGGTSEEIARAIDSLTRSLSHLPADNPQAEAYRQSVLTLLPLLAGHPDLAYALRNSAGFQEFVADGLARAGARPDDPNRLAALQAILILASPNSAGQTELQGQNPQTGEKFRAPIAAMVARINNPESEAWRLGVQILHTLYPPRR